MLFTDYLLFMFPIENTWELCNNKQWKLQQDLVNYHIRVPSVNKSQVLQGPDLRPPVALLYA